MQLMMVFGRSDFGGMDWATRYKNWSICQKITLTLLLLFGVKNEAISEW